MGVIRAKVRGGWNRQGEKERVRSEEKGNGRGVEGRG